MHQLLGTLLLPVIGAAIVLVLALTAARCKLPRGQRGLRAVALRKETQTLQLWLLLLLSSYNVCAPACAPHLSTGLA
mgnify:CR=1 FL=1